MEASKC